MRVEIVAEGFQLESGVGTERYSWELLQGMTAAGVKVTAVSSDPSRKRLALAANAFTMLPFRTLRQMAHTDIVHATDPSSGVCLPFTGHKTVVTFHDLMPYLLRAAHYRLGDRVFSILTYTLSARCDAIIAVSQQTKEEVVRYLKIPSHKVKVIHLGTSKSFSVINRIRKEPLTVGYVGDINPRKKIDFLLEGFAMLKRQFPESKLLIVGSNIAEHLDSERRRLLRLVAKLELGQSVVFTGHVAEGRLAELYNAMGTLILPSDYEGFGLPILEAERCGTPVVVRKGARIPAEVSAACMKVSSASELAECIAQLVSSPQLRKEQVQKGLEHSKPFSWDRCVNETLLTYKDVMRK